MSMEQAVENILFAYGSDMTLTRDARTAPIYDPSTGEMSAPTPGTFTIRGVFTNFNDRNSAGTTVKAGDRRLLVSAANSETAPQIGDRVEGLTILPGIRTYAPNGVAVGWACQARK